MYTRLYMCKYTLQRQPYMLKCILFRLIDNEKLKIIKSQYSFCDSTQELLY